MFLMNMSLNSRNNGVKMKINNIVYVTSTSFPFGSASSARTRNIVNLLVHCGFFVTVIADYKQGDDSLFNVLYLANNKIKQKEASQKCLLTLSELIKKQRVDVIITNAVFYKVRSLIAFCKKNGIKLVVENCEWYDKSNYRLGSLNPLFIENQYMLKHLFKKVDGFISISDYLNKRNLALGKPSVRIPTIIDKEELDYNLHPMNRVIKLSYCGNPGVSKEYLLPVIDAIKNNDLFKKRIRFHIFGPSKEQVQKNINNIDVNLFDKFVEIHGMIPQQDIHEVFKETDFLIFLRPLRKSSNAGFPTKLAESMISGTPVISNDTGDISLYLEKKNGFLLKDASSKSVAECFDQVLKLTDEEYLMMRERCRIDAENSFDFRCYKESIINLFNLLEDD